MNFKAIAQRALDVMRAAGMTEEEITLSMPGVLALQLAYEAKKAGRVVTAETAQQTGDVLRVAFLTAAAAVCHEEGVCDCPKSADPRVNGPGGDA